ncbi:MAG: glycosyltransferase family 2 protein [Actinomycetota bacterium]
MSDRALVSVAIPAYNESDNLDELASRLQAVFATLAEKYDFEVVICENGSQDDTYDKLLKIREKDPRFKIVQLVRNFHMEGGMGAALAHVSGDACLIMSADLQDPPEMIPTLIEQWEQGYENVYTVITKRHGEGRFRRGMAQLFYWVINKVSDTPVPRNASDFRLVSKPAYEAFNALPERNRMVRALWGWLGFRSIGVEYERLPRSGGNSKFKPFATAGFAVRGILSSSYTPLKAIPLLGAGLSMLSFVALGGMVVRAFVWGVPFPGFGTIVSLMLLLFGFLFLLLGVVSEYIGMIFEESRQRPGYLIRQRHGIDSDT